MYILALSRENLLRIRVSLQNSWLRRASMNIRHFIVKLILTTLKNVELLKRVKMKETAQAASVV
jgi:hypothetical protein